MTTVESLLKDGLRALFTLGISQEFYNATNDERKEIGGALAKAFDDLEGRFGIKVLATFDDDLLQCGPNTGFPWIGYIIAELPNLEAAVAVSNLVRTPFKDTMLVKYLRIESRIGHILPFGNR